MSSSAPALRLLDNLVGLFYPRLCLACSHNLPPRSRLLCVSCQYELPKTRYHELPDNPFTERFWGRVAVVSGAAMYHYAKGGKVQRLIHQLKYHQQPEIGLELGRIYGQQLRVQPHFAGLEAVAPVPLHPRKQHQRGYNQSEYFARGLAESLDIPCWPHLLRRHTHTSSQTAKSRQERLENVLQAFAVADPQRAAGRHILLADDVLTTGATLEACATQLLTLPGTRVSLATIGVAGE